MDTVNSSESFVSFAARHGFCTRKAPALESITRRHRWNQFNMRRFRMMKQPYRTKHPNSSPSISLDGRLMVFIASLLCIDRQWHCAWRNSFKIPFTLNRQIQNPRVLIFNVAAMARCCFNQEQIHKHTKNARSENDKRESVWIPFCSHSTASS